VLHLPGGKWDSLQRLFFEGLLSFLKIKNGCKPACFLAADFTVFVLCVQLFENLTDAGFPLQRFSEYRDGCLVCADYEVSRVNGPWSFSFDDKVFGD
jgi:hypothetical protein